MQMAEAVEHMPSLVLLEDLHLLTPVDSQNPQQMPSPQSGAVVEWLCLALGHLRCQAHNGLPLPGQLGRACVCVHATIACIASCVLA